MPEAIFYRAGRELFRQHMPDPPPPHYRTRHTEAFRVLSTGEFDPAALTDYAEVFERNVGFRCPNCDCVVYNSKNWHELPPWVFKQEDDAREHREREARFNKQTQELMLRRFS